MGVTARLRLGMAGGCLPGESQRTPEAPTRAASNALLPISQHHFEAPNLSPPGWWQPLSPVFRSAVRSRRPVPDRTIAQRGLMPHNRSSTPGTSR